MRSPFKLLDAYQYEDHEVFFGRDEETVELYQMIFKTPLLLIYGSSGTGKSSLVQCGLANRFDGTDWFPFFIRRQDDINNALRNALQHALPPKETPKNNLNDAVSFLFQYYLRPIYLIFDQLEELFILGNKEEQENFGKAIQDLIASELPCKIIFLMREEFIGQLFLLEKFLPSIYDFRLRVEPMGFKKIQEVVLKSCEHYNIQFEEAEKDIQQIYDNLSGGKSGIQLPYLQVYLDMLYREDFQRSYPDAAKSANLPFPLPPLTFSSAEIAQLGNIQDVLGKFLQEQEQLLIQAINAEFGQQIEVRIQNLLDAFVTEEGTKRPIHYQRIEHNIILEEKANQYVFNLSTPMLSYALERLIAARILRDQDNRLELAHDALAALIDRRRTTEQRLRNEAFSRLNSYYKAFPLTQEYLSRKQLNSLEDFLPLWETTLDAGLKQFLQDSYEFNEQKENARLLAEQKKRKRALFIAAIGLLLALIATLASVYAVQSRNQLALAIYDAQLKSARVLKVQGKYTDALVMLTRTAQFSNNFTPIQKTTLKTLQKNWKKIQNLQKQALIQIGQSNYPKAIGLYQEMYNIDPDERINNLIKSTQQELESAFVNAVQTGDFMLLSGRITEAKAAYEKALRLKPKHPVVNEKLKLLLKK